MVLIGLKVFLTTNIVKVKGDSVTFGLHEQLVSNIFVNCLFSTADSIQLDAVLLCLTVSVSLSVTLQTCLSLRTLPLDCSCWLNRTHTHYTHHTHIHLNATSTLTNMMLQMKQQLNFLFAFYLFFLPENGAAVKGTRLVVLISWLAGNASCACTPASINAACKVDRSLCLLSHFCALYSNLF